MEFYEEKSRQYHKLFLSLLLDHNKLHIDNVPFPQVKVEDYLRQAVTDVVSLLKNPPASTYPTLQYGNSTLNAFRQIAETLNRAAQVPAPTATPNVPPTSVRYLST